MGLHAVAAVDGYVWGDSDLGEWDDGHSFFTIIVIALVSVVVIVIIIINASTARTLRSGKSNLFPAPPFSLSFYLLSHSDYHFYITPPPALPLSSNFHTPLRIYNIPCKSQFPLLAYLFKSPAACTPLLTDITLPFFHFTCPFLLF